ncbi:Hypothetical_protein [Hexamita inflata]|uniref:Hypothetical_protein n=1 Tax=Hexamita inflata TaxID=28002 RepID=A0AA86PER7_9EUKA|nr:Hypothetical protein HINF_LOCUS24883 [Hexamita inflata]CAI9937239.1 Hypothetical protein HINF_LOCUS24884 [Hexamita inflata]CAI9937240.1 Hypothetical protein HINF_LOCUS24885 [Hexamita inflata]
MFKSHAKNISKRSSQRLRNRNAFGTNRQRAEQEFDVKSLATYIWAIKIQVLQYMILQFSECKAVIPFSRIPIRCELRFFVLQIVYTNQITGVFFKNVRSNQCAFEMKQRSRILNSGWSSGYSGWSDVRVCSARCICVSVRRTPGCPVPIEFAHTVWYGFNQAEPDRVVSGKY